MSVRDAARLLGLTEKAVRQRIAHKAIPYRRWGGRIVILRSELLEYLKALPGCTVEEATAAVGRITSDRR